MGSYFKESLFKASLISTLKLLVISFFCSGRFSSVKKCIRKDSSEQIFAAKIIKKRNVQHAINELRIFQLSHKHSNFVTFQHNQLHTEILFEVIINPKICRERNRFFRSSLDHLLQHICLINI